MRQLGVRITRFGQAARYAAPIRKLSGIFRHPAENLQIKVSNGINLKLNGKLLHFILTASIEIIGIIGAYLPRKQELHFRREITTTLDFWKCAVHTWILWMWMIFLRWWFFVIFNSKMIRTIGYFFLLNFCSWANGETDVTGLSLAEIHFILRKKASAYLIHDIEDTQTQETEIIFSYNIHNTHK